MLRQKRLLVHNQKSHFMHKQWLRTIFARPAKCWWDYSCFQGADAAKSRKASEASGGWLDGHLLAIHVRLFIHMRSCRVGWKFCNTCHTCIKYCRFQDRFILLSSVAILHVEIDYKPEFNAESLAPIAVSIGANYGDGNYRLKYLNSLNTHPILMKVVPCDSLK